MKSSFARIALVFITLTSMHAFAQSGDLAPITDAEIKAAVAGKEAALARAKSGLGKRYCAADGSAGMRYYMDSQVRIGYLFPFVQNIERGMEAPGLIQVLKTIPMPKEVAQTYQMYGIQGKILNEVVVVNMLSYDAGQPLTTYASLGFYLDEQGNVDRDNSILLLTDQRNGTFFVGSTKACR